MSIKSELLSKLKQEHCFWSFSDVSVNDIPDDILIEKTLQYLDLEEIDQTVRSALNFVLADKVDTVLHTALVKQTELHTPLLEIPQELQHRAPQQGIRQ